MLSLHSCLIPCSCCSGQWAPRQLWWINPIEEIGLSNVKSTLVLESNSWRGRKVERLESAWEERWMDEPERNTLHWRECVRVCVCVCVEKLVCTGCSCQKPKDQTRRKQGLRSKLKVWSDPDLYTVFLHGLYFALNVIETKMFVMNQGDILCQKITTRDRQEPSHNWLPIATIYQVWHNDRGVSPVQIWKATHHIFCCSDWL